MARFSLNGAFTALPDPNYSPYPIPVRGGFLNHKPVLQGFESGVLKWTLLPSAAFNELRARYEANKNVQTSGAIPAISGYGFRAVSAFFMEPLYSDYDGPIANNVSMIVAFVGNY